jgi:hypothetical protein
MAWTWTGFKYDPVFRFKDKDFFQPGLNQAEARFWKLKIHKETDRRGTRSSIKFTDEEVDLDSYIEKDCEIPRQDMEIVEEDEGEEREEDSSKDSYKKSEEPSGNMFVQESQYKYRATSPDSTSSHFTPVQYSTERQNTPVHYCDNNPAQYSTDRQYRNTSVSSLDSGIRSMRSSSRGSSWGGSKDYQYGYGHGEEGVKDSVVKNKVEHSGKKDKEHLSSKFY